MNFETIKFKFGESDSPAQQNIAKITVMALTFFMAFFKSISAFGMTAWFIYSGIDETQTVARLLQEIFIGYQISWTGSFIAMLYGWVIGGIIGFAIGHIYNRIVDSRNS